MDQFNVIILASKNIQKIHTYTKNGIKYRKLFQAKTVEETTT